MVIDILLSERKHYSFESVAAKRVEILFKKWGVSSETYVLSDGILGEYLQKACLDPPDWILSFTDLLPNEKPFCDLVQCPHFVWLEDSFAEGAHYLNSPYARLGVRDRALTHALSNLHFLPRGIEIEEKSEVPLFDVVFFANLTDHEVKEQTWHTLFEKQEVQLIKRASSQCRQQLTLHPFFSILNTMKEYGKQAQISLQDLICGVEEDLKAERALHLISSFEGQRLDVFGEHRGKNWGSRLQNYSSIYLHGSLPFSEHVEVLKRSRIVLFDHIESQESTPPWFLEALAVGCLPLINKTPYLAELVSDSPIFYKDPQELLVKVAFYLKFPEKRENEIRTLAEKLLKTESWEARTQDLLRILA